MNTYFDRVWDEHVVESLGGDEDLVWIDRHFTHDLSGPFSFRALEKRGLSVRRPDLTVAVVDHGVSTEPGRDEASTPASAKLLPLYRELTRAHGVPLYSIDDPRQGIVHVVGPELGLCQPGSLIVCGDSHTCTQGGVGAIAWGIGNTEVLQVLATQTLIVQRPQTLLVRIRGSAGPGVGAKDLALALIARHGADAGSGFAIEYAGEAVDALSVEGRLTLCNLSVEFGARIGFVPPDEKTLDWLEGRPAAPKGAAWDAAAAHWRGLRSGPDASWDAVLELDASSVEPQVSWGTSPAHTIGLGDTVPDPRSAPDEGTADSWRKALEYMGLEPGARLCGLPVQHVFIGSCTNSRLEDLERAAALVRGHKVAPGVRAWVVPGSREVARRAEAAGLHEVFVDAGFAWREPGCSMCMSMNGDTVPAGERCVSTSNRNFVGRQGAGARTHLASPETAAASAIAGCIADAREEEGARA
jgi:3-isopropylmalate/(R)-2-methylmalate dehydratase large subunit